VNLKTVKFIKLLILVLREGVRPPSLAVLSSTHVAAIWQPPAVPNGRIVNYTLYLAPNVGVYTGLSMSTVVSDLSPWTNYSFRLSACTQSGCAVSPEAEVATWEAPPAGLGEPRLGASAVGQIFVEWAAPRSPNGVITGYELYRRALNYTSAQGSVSFCFWLLYAGRCVSCSA